MIEKVPDSTSDNQSETTSAAVFETVTRANTKPVVESVTSKPYWWETELVTPGRGLRGEVRCDVCIVGAGYTGLWTAYHLKRADPTLNIQVIDADHAGAGASGHADGFITPTIGRDLRTLVRGFGAEQAKLAYAVVARSIVEINRFCRTHDIDAELEPNGYYQVATSTHQIRRLERDLEVIDRLGAAGSVELLDRDTAQQRIGSPAIHAAFQIGGAMVNPRKLVRGIYRVVQGQGVPVYERTPAYKIVKTPAGQVVHTPLGQVTADKVVLATDAYQHQFPGFEDQVRPFWSYAVVTEPLTDDQLAQVPWPGREGFVEARNEILFARLTRQNRLLVGGGPARYQPWWAVDERRMPHLGATTLLRKTLARYFPAWAGVRITHAYGGCVAMTRDFVPHIGTDGNGVYYAYAYGYCGNGTALTHTAGKVLRDLILERDTSYTKLLFVNGRERGFGPEPVAFLRAQAQPTLMALRDRYPMLLDR